MPLIGEAPADEGADPGRAAIAPPARVDVRATPPVAVVGRGGAPRLSTSPSATYAALASALSAWHLEVTRSQQTRLETLVQTCDALGGAAAEAAETATATEARCATLEEARDEAEDRAKVLERRVRGQEEETRGAEALAAANAGVAAAWRVAAERGVSAAKEATERLANWSAEIERDRGGFLRAVGHSTEKKKNKNKVINKNDIVTRRRRQ